MAKLTNYTEKLVIEELKKVIKDRKDICRCRTCQVDIMACALNKLPPHYVSSEGGHIHTMVSMSTDQLKVQVITALLGSIDAVAKHPRHDSKKGLYTISRK
jgi:competence protein ComFB